MMTGPTLAASTKAVNWNAAPKTSSWYVHHEQSQVVNKTSFPELSALANTPRYGRPRAVEEQRLTSQCRAMLQTSSSIAD